MRFKHLVDYQNIKGNYSCHHLIIYIIYPAWVKTLCIEMLYCLYICFDPPNYIYIYKKLEIFTNNNSTYIYAYIYAHTHTYYYIHVCMYVLLLFVNTSNFLHLGGYAHVKYG